MDTAGVTADGTVLGVHGDITEVTIHFFQHIVMFRMVWKVNHSGVTNDYQCCTIRDFK